MQVGIKGNGHCLPDEQRDAWGESKSLDMGGVPVPNSRSNIIMPPS